MHATTHSITVSQVREAIARTGYIQDLDMRSAIAARVIDGVRVVECPLIDRREVYDWTQCDDAVSDGTVFLFANNTRAGVMVEAWPVIVVGEHGEQHGLADGYTWETLDGGKYAAAAAVARRLVVA